MTGSVIVTFEPATVMFSRAGEGSLFENQQNVHNIMKLHPDPDKSRHNIPVTRAQWSLLTASVGNFTIKHLTKLLPAVDPTFHAHIHYCLGNEPVEAHARISLPRENVIRQ